MGHDLRLIMALTQAFRAKTAHVKEYIEGVVLNRRSRMTEAWTNNDVVHDRVTLCVTYTELNTHTQAQKINNTYYAVMHTYKHAHTHTHRHTQTYIHI